MNKKRLRRLAHKSCAFLLCAFYLTCCRDDSRDFPHKFAEIVAHYSDPDPDIAERAFHRAIALCEEYRSKSGGFDFDYFQGVSHGRLALLLEKQGRLQESKAHLGQAVAAFKASKTVSHVQTEKDALEFFEYMGWKPKAQTRIEEMPESIFGMNRGAVPP